MSALKNIIIPGEKSRKHIFYRAKNRMGTILQFAAFMSGFAVKSMANVQINDNPNPYFLTAYAVLTTFLVISMAVVMLLCMWIAPLLKTAEIINNEIEDLLEAHNLHNIDLESLSAMLDKDGKGYGLKTYRMNKFTIRAVGLAWTLASTIALILFVCDAILIFWIKMQHFTEIAAYAATGILAAGLVLLIGFVWYFRRYYVDKFKIFSKVHRSRYGSISM